jgi:hypothetical protein
MSSSSGAIMTPAVEVSLLPFTELWHQARSFDAFLAASGANRGLWEGLYRLARVPAWAEGVTGGRTIRLLVLAEDWCGDASNTVPFLARWASQTPGVELRILRRDEHPEVMNRYLSNGSRSIPIVIVLDEDFEELGHWGPRPIALQKWVMENRGSMPKAELYPQVRKWYAKDRGETTLREVLDAAGAAT